MRSELRLACTWATLFCLAPVGPAVAQDVETFFRNNCGACHTIGHGRLMGPDLKGATQRRDRAWLTEFIQSPQKVIERGDPYALALQKEYYGLIMPTLPTVTPELATALVDYIDAQSGGATTASTPEPAPVAFAPGDVIKGRDLFTGRQRLSAGGPACISCHTSNGIGGLGGGKLAPDLTLVSQRLGGARGVTAWLRAPATPTMKSLFAKSALSDQEIEPLVAYFENSARSGGGERRTGLVAFATLGLTLAAVGLVIMDSAWKNRFRGVRRALVEQAKRS